MNSSQNKPSLLRTASIVFAARLKALALTISLLALLTGLPSTAISSTILTFEGLGFSEGTLFTAIPGLEGITFENIYYVLPGAPRYAFNGSSEGGAGDIDDAHTGAFIGVPVADGSAGIIRSAHPLSDVGLMVLDIDHTQIVSEFCTIRLFDAEFGGSELASFTLTNTDPIGGDGVAAPISFEGISGVQRIEFNGYERTGIDGAGYGVDNVSFTVVPEPSTSLLGAAGVVCIVLRRNRKCLKF